MSIVVRLRRYDLLHDQATSETDMSDLPATGCGTTVRSGHVAVPEPRRPHSWVRARLDRNLVENARALCVPQRVVCERRRLPHV